MGANPIWFIEAKVVPGDTILAVRFELFPLSSDSLHYSQRVTIKRDRRLKPDVINAERRAWGGAVLSPHRENR